MGKIHVGFRAFLAVFSTAHSKPYLCSEEYYYFRIYLYFKCSVFHPHDKLRMGTWLKQEEEVRFKTCQDLSSVMKNTA